MTTYGFELLRTEEIPEINSAVKLYRHMKTGAQLLSVENEDENKVFGITFRTPPGDSTGVPHIMEHAVLCGSRKYPVKEPFVELMKGSLNTFLNAMTFSDKTCYPVASQNLQDFYNLIDVYLDAVFYPRLTPEIFQQEGWHYELEDPANPLTYKGVVYNEMKGAYSSPESLIGRYSEQSLFPDITYHHDSGGDPTVIPDLTYAQFIAFHETFYHPSNARIFFYGDDDPAERLRLMDVYLRDYDARAVESAVPLQAARGKPRRVTQPYPVAEGEEQKKAMLTVNWLLPENREPELTLALTLLSHALLGIPASPLRKALIDSGLGEDILGRGLDDSLRQLYFTVGLKGVLPENVERVEALILDTLRELAEEGIDPDTVAASLNTLEFQLREQNYGRYPRGLVVMLQALGTWLHEGDPFAAIAFEAPLGTLKERLGAQPDYLQALIHAHLLENHHRATVVLEPDPTLQQRQETVERERLAAARAVMTPEEIDTTISQTRRLQLLQETPDSPEALATIPTLTLDDLDAEPTPVPTEITELAGTQVLYHDLFTNGILYLDVGFNLHALPQELLPYVPLLGDAFLELGTEAQDFVKLTQRIGRETGGISATRFTSSVRTDGDKDATAWQFLRAKATVAQTGALLDILHDVLLTVKLDNRERFMQMLLERKAQAESRLIPWGHRVVATHLRARLDPGYWAAEQMSGVRYLLFLRQLIRQAEEDWPAVLEKLEQVRDRLLNRKAMLCNVTLDAENWQGVQPQVDAFLAALPADGAQPAHVPWSPEYEAAPAGLTIPAQVNYVGKGADLYRLGYERDGSAEVITHYLRSTWLWERVRVQGGAYGGFALFDQHSGVFAYISYRDPNLLRTLQIYDQTAEYLRNLSLSQEELVKGIIGAIGNIDSYQLPDAKGYGALTRYLVGYTDAERQAYRTQVLNTTAEDFREFAAALEALARQGAEVVMGPQEALLAANTERDQPFELTAVL